eukprot:910364-Karenia_brevis.AAC.1
MTKLHDKIKGFKAAYGGGTFNTPHNLTSVQIASGLPPKGLGGSVDLTKLVTGSTLTWLLNPSVLHKDECDWPERVPKAKTFCLDKDYPE